MVCAVVILAIPVLFSFSSVIVCSIAVVPTNVIVVYHYHSMYVNRVF